VVDNLCAYFWQTVGGLTLVAIICAGLLWLTYATVCIPWQIWDASVRFEAHVAAFIWTVVAGLYFWSRWYDYRQEHPRAPSVITAYLKAKKQKVCPTLEFEE
jgi:membrane protein implicated in regulation of membrane protease activity